MCMARLPGMGKGTTTAPKLATSPRCTSLHLHCLCPQPLQGPLDVRVRCSKLHSSLPCLMRCDRGGEAAASGEHAQRRLLHLAAAANPCCDGS